MTSAAAKSQFRPAKEAHEALYSKFLQQQNEGRLEDDNIRAQLNDEVDALLETLKEVDTSLLAQSDYEWLSNALLSWQAVTTSILRKPRYIEIPEPPLRYPREGNMEILSQEGLEQWLKDKAHYLSRVRRGRELLDLVERRLAATFSQPEEVRQDWHKAKIHLAAEVLRGNLSFVEQLTSKSYGHLEEVWLSEVKALMAYLVWKDKGSRYWEDSNADYFEACNILRQRFLSFPARDSAEGFEEPRAYLNACYLTADGRFDEAVSEKAHQLVERKAHRLWECTSCNDEQKNWRAAIAFCQRFYESIVAAVVQKDPEACRVIAEALGLVRSRQHPPPQLDLINAFEAALGIHYADPQACPEKDGPDSSREEIGAPDPKELLEP